jgi:hypothetical protein
MNTLMRGRLRLAVFALCAAAPSAFAPGAVAPSEAQTITPQEVRYQTGCEPVDALTVEGFVSNPGTAIVQIDGPVRFSFTVANAMSRPVIQVQAARAVPPGRTMTIARTRLAWSLLPNEVCKLDVLGAVR